MHLSLHYATVVDNDDSDKKAKIQIRILPEMDGFEASKLPWYRPFMNEGMTADQFSNNLPAVDSKIWVVATDKLMIDGYYITGSFIDGFFDYSTIQTALDNVAELSDSTYANIKFNKYTDGTVVFHNDDTGETGIYHSSGKYIVIDVDGLTTVNGSVTVKEDGIVEGSLAVGSAAEPAVMWTSFKTAMSLLLTALSTHVHTDPLSGSTGPPLPPLTTYATTGAPLNMDLAESQDLTTS